MTAELIAPALAIDITIGTQCEITFKRGAETQPVLRVVNPELSQAKLSQLRARVRTGLNDFRTKLGGEARPNLSQSLTALRELHKCGRHILMTLFGDNTRRRLPEAVELCQEACPNWAKPGWDADSLRASLIVVRTSVGDGIPVDVLPLLNFDPGSDVEVSFENLGRLASSFLGFSAIVKREVGMGMPASMHLENIPRLPIKMFIHRGLNGARNEETYLSQHKHISMEQAWPDGNAPSNSEAFSKALAKYLWEPEIGFNGKPRSQADQVCHFACHCNASTAPPVTDYELLLQSGKVFGGQTVRLDSLTDELAQLGIKSPTDRRPRPLVFINACGTGDLDPAGAGSFPDLFLKKDLGFIGFVGTETTIPDEFASEFSKQFYDHLLAAIPIGQALHAVRWKLLASHYNPLAILYSLYAEPEIRVRSPVDLFQTAPPPDDTAAASGILPWIRRLWRRATKRILFS